MVEAHDRLQRAAADMNKLRFSTTNPFLPNDMDLLSQQLSQNPGDISGGQSLHTLWPIPYNAKRSCGDDSPFSRRSQRTPLSAIRNCRNAVPTSNARPKLIDNRFPGSSTQDEEGMSKNHPSLGSEYGYMIADEDGFSQFDT